ncbi:apoptotic protease-activating factor 1-like isoform X2 [Daphnia pulex]|uniref:apoptotic protease-activating factor 1-like isoform X2 n=1 Tax=Daphnia pulex TaxID=6669 RepID=UPI001EDE5D02|nr:apoptotic protease-activating factor 1-like isoform X2 [Daphnia pulex]
MNTVEKAALLRNRDAIVQSVDFTYVREKLVAYGVLTVHQAEDVNCEKTKTAKVRRLLDLLTEIGQKDTFKTFVKILEFDYDWIADKLNECNNRDSPDAASHLNSDPLLAADNLQHLLIQCGIPFPPPHLISRHVKVAQIRECLQGMDQGQFVVIHGMAGAGKSVLAAESIRDIDLLVNTFENNVYWLTIGQTGTDTLLTKMQALCERLDHTVLPPLSVDQATERLRRLMTDPSRKKSLIILDDVWRGEVVRAFDFGCRILMTTRDASVTEVVNGRDLLVKVQDGFTQEESLCYLANCLNISEQDLPEQADQIYSESKGSPMVLSLLAPLLAERGDRQRIDVHRWDHYLGKLRDRKYTQIRRHGSYNYETINEAISISFDHLDEDTRHSLKDFVIFLDDVNIPAPVLQILWKCSRYEMEERISLLVANSLVAQHFQEHSSNCIVLYGIHDLLLDYLKSHMSAEEQRNAHRKLVDSYFAECKDNFGELPDDNYIFWFLGYHLYKAEYTEFFPRVYLNLSFVSAKLRATGPSDLLNDFRKYKDYISEISGRNSQRVEDYMHFIRTCGHIVVHCRHLDIVQLALQQPKNSSVYNDALELAKKAKEKFYLECRSVGSQTKESMDQVLRSTILNYGHVTAACFTQDGQRLLSAVDDGQIRMWDVDSGKELHRFIGHSGSIHQLSLSKDAKRFVSSSADGSVKVWDLSAVIGKLDEIEHRPNKTPSPRMRQDSWHNMFDVSDRVITDNSLTTYTGHTNEVLGARFSENGAQVVSCGLDNTARIWLSTACMELGVLEHPEPVTTCCFSECGVYVATGCTDSSIRIWNGEISLYTCVAFFPRQDSSPRILFISFLSKTSLLSVSDNEILQFEWTLSSDKERESDTPFPKSIAKASSSWCYNCATVTDNKQLLAVTTSKDNILLYNIDSAEQIFEYVGHSGTINTLHFSPSESSDDPPKWLLSGSIDKTLKVWNVTDVERVDQCSLSCSAFHAVCPPDQSSNFLIATVGSDNHIQVVSGSNCETLLTTNDVESGSDQVEICVLSHQASMMAWSTVSGLVKLMSLDRSEVKTLGHHSDAKVTLLKFSPSDVLLLTVSSEGCIKIWKPRSETVTISGPRKGVIDCFFVEPEETTIIVCGADGSIRLWDVKTGYPKHLIMEDYRLSLTCVDRASNRQWLAQGTTTQGVQIVQIPSVSELSFSSSPRQSTTFRKPFWLGHQLSPVRVCRFASHVELIAVGYDTGIIEVFDYLRNTLKATLEAHQSWVRDLQFCQNSPFFQLVSLGDRIAWWNISSAHSGTIAQNLHSNGSSHLAGGMGFPLTPITPGSSSSISSSSRFADASITPSSQFYGLVQTVEFQTRGRYASKLFVSGDGRALVTVSDSGILYILHQLPHH